MIAIHKGDCLHVMRGMPAASVDSIVTDPPYGLAFMGKKWDYDVPSTEIWAECLRILKPGGHLLAFAGTRTQHRMAVRIEDAGFEIRDMLAWVYGSGFPKSHNLTGEWEGFGTALKPALEPITMARKPLAGTVAANVLAHGTGAMNIDGCRIATDPAIDDPRLGGVGTWSSDKMAKNVYEGGYSGKEVASSPLGRWPANLLHDGSAEVLALFPDSKGQQGAVRGTEASKTGDANCYGEFGRVPFAARGDTGSAARFFYCAKASKADRDEGLEAFEKQSGGMVSNTSGQHMTRRDDGYEVAPRANIHPTVKPTDLMRYLCRLVTPPGGLVLDPFMGSGSTGKAALLEGFGFVGIERAYEYLPISMGRIFWAAREAERIAAAGFQMDLFGGNPA